MSDHRFFERAAYIGAILMLIVFGFVFAASPRELAPDVAEACIGTACALALLPRVCVAIMRWYDRREARRSQRSQRHSR